jgi:predicted dehydrogenase
MCFTDGDWTGNAHGLIDVGEQPPPFPAEGPPPEFAADEEALWALATGVDQLVHPLNLLRHFVGEPYRLVFAHATGRLYAFESESGVPMAIEVSPYRLSVGYDEELLVAFEHGYVRLCPAPSLAVNRAGRVEIYRDPGGVLPQRIAPELTWIDPQQAQAASFLRVCRGEVPPPTDAMEAAVDLHLVADIVRTRVALPGARDALRADREERDRAWEERRQTIEGKR